MVYKYSHFKARLVYKFLGNRKPVISKDELLHIIDVYKNSKDESL
jgi:hypothetical protein